jgi:hypothetical protein
MAGEIFNNWTIKKAESENTGISFCTNNIKEPILELCGNGDIKVNGKLVENDKEVVDGMRKWIAESHSYQDFSALQDEKLKFRTQIEILWELGAGQITAEHLSLARHGLLK